MRIKRIIVPMVVTVLVTLAACASPTTSTPVAKLPNKQIPAYTININFQSQQVEQGDSVAIPVTVKSLVDQPINLKLVLEANVGQLPQFLTYSQPNEGQFVTLAPNTSLDTQIMITVSDDAQVGDYHIGIHGLLQEPVKDRSTETTFFDLVVISK